MKEWRVTYRQLTFGGDTPIDAVFEERILGADAERQAREFVISVEGKKGSPQNPDRVVNKDAKLSVREVGSWEDVDA